MILGLGSIARASTDAKILLAQRFLRMFAYGQTSLVIALFFQDMGVPDDQIGLLMSLTLLGDVILSWILTFHADGLGRRLVLKIGCIAMLVSGIVFALSSNYWVLLVAAIIGVISSSGDETGPFKAVEESTLAHLTHIDHLPDLFAWHGIIGTIGSALGTLAGGLMVELPGGLRLIFWCYAVIAGVKLVMVLFLSVECEDRQYEEFPDSETSNGDNSSHSVAVTQASPISPAAENTALLGDQQQQQQMQAKINISLLITLCILFGIDSLGYGFMSNSWLVVYFKRRFGVSESCLGSLLFTTTLLGSVTQLFSSVVCKTVGPVLAMVLTKLPSAVSMASIPLGRTIAQSMALLVIRTATDSMDVVPRQVFLSTVMAPQHRTKVMGTVNVVKTLTRAVGPYFTGLFASQNHLDRAFAAVGIFEAVYAVLLISVFLLYSSR